MEKRNKRIVTAVATFAPTLFFLVLPFYRPAQVPVFLLFLGRFHPLVLHFPIVLIILALVLETAGQFRQLKKVRRIVGFILVAGILTSFIAVLAGFLLFASGDYSGPLVERHFWAGAMTGAAISATTGVYFLYRKSGRHYAIYFCGLLISNVVMGYASHIGGTITHGKDFLTAYVPAILENAATPAMKPESEMLVYSDMLAPMLEFKCAGCHNPARAKGNFVVTNYQSLLKPGESGKPPVTKGATDKSEMLTRVMLPVVHDDHMPPEGKTPLSDDEIQLLRLWIKAGAPEGLRNEDAKKDDSMAVSIRKVLPALARYQRKSGIAKVRAEALQKEMRALASHLEIYIGWDSTAADDLFTLAMTFPPNRFSSEQVKELMPFAENFSKISLTSSAIDDEALYYLAQMPNLRALYLQKTRLNGSGLIHLQKLQNLEILNLSFTRVDDNAAIDLLKITALRQVYLYRTKTSRAVLDALMKNKPGLEILDEEGPYF